MSDWILRAKHNKGHRLKPLGIEFKTVASIKDACLYTDPHSAINYVNAAKLKKEYKEIAITKIIDDKIIESWVWSKK